MGNAINHKHGRKFVVLIAKTSSLANALADLDRDSRKRHRNADGNKYTNNVSSTFSYPLVFPEADFSRQRDITYAKDYVVEMTSTITCGPTDPMPPAGSSATAQDAAAVDAAPAHQVPEQAAPAHAAPDPPVPAVASAHADPAIAHAAPEPAHAAGAPAHAVPMHAVRRAHARRPP